MSLLLTACLIPLWSKTINCIISIISSLKFLNIYWLRIYYILVNVQCVVECTLCPFEYSGLEMSTKLVE